MSNINQLLAKAMSTTSEEEAMSCLRMARKKGSSFNIPQPSSGLYKDKDAKYWYDRASFYYNQATNQKSNQGGMSLEAQKALFRSYNEYVDKYWKERRKVLDLQIKLDKLKEKSPMKMWIAIAVIQSFVILGLVAFIS